MKLREIAVEFIERHSLSNGLDKISGAAAAADYDDVYVHLFTYNV